LYHTVWAHHHRIMRTLAFVFLVFLLSVASSVFAQDATTPTTTTVDCCRIRVESVTISGSSNGTAESARVVVRWLRSDDSIREERGFEVTDGDPATNADNFLWGTGIAPQPFGLMRRIGAFATEETGSLKQRFNKAVLRWLQTTGRIGASEYTIP
jgi:hypothetical protein